MKFSVLIPSRGRVRQLSAALTSILQCRSGEHEICVCVACDDDDPKTRAFLDEAIQELPVAIRYGPRPDTLGSVANDMALHWPADAYVVFADDLLCMTDKWDAIVASAVEEKPYGVFWWRSARAENTLVPIVTERWRAAAGQIFTEYFPFWYDDMWLFELWLMATNSDPIVLPIEVLDKPYATQRMRDLDFWQTFYETMRRERVEHAGAIADALGLPRPVFADNFHERMAVLRENDKLELADIEHRNKAEKTPPSAQYLRTKLAATLRMNRMLKRVA